MEPLLATSELKAFAALAAYDQLRFPIGLVGLLFEFLGRDTYR